MADLRPGGAANRDGLMTEEQLRAAREARGGSTFAAPSTALNLAAVLSLADTEPERNPRNSGIEVVAQAYRRIARLENRVGLLEQNS